MTPAGLAESSHTVVRPIPTLSEDIVAQVCDEIFATPIYQYDLSLPCWLRSQWLDDVRFRKGIPLVSKLWWKPATRGLYEHVIIRQVDQIPPLVRTLTSKDAGFDLGALVRRITLHWCVVYPPDSNSLGEHVRAIFERCVALEQLSFQRHPDCEDAVSESDSLVSQRGIDINPVWIFPQIIFPVLQAQGPTMLRKLDLVSLNCGRWEEKATTALYNLILASPRITTLAIQNLHTPGSEPPTLEFLEELCLCLQYFTPPDPNQPSSRDVWMWGFPSLQSLALLNGYELPTIILKTLGRTLTYLHLCYPIRCEDLRFDRLSQLCPVLEHLVFYPQQYSPEWISGASMEPFRRLRYLDVWLQPHVYKTRWSSNTAASLVERARSGFAPALEGVRGLLVLMPLYLPSDLPGTICHPSVITRADGTRFVCVCDVPMVQTAWCVRPVADWWLDREMW
ncbi:hypothetical protein LXA43DRAFT_1184931 [Ganoderma leucocontextum]|nr:hypothetical protein LXA43DRAFT_1184931 [Ganoderma leucocontextum]